MDTTSRLVVLLSLCVLFSLFSIFLLLNGGFALSKLLNDVVMSSERTLHPGVTDNISHTKTLVSGGLEHVGDQIFESFTKETGRLAGRVILPEEISAVSGQKLVVGVVRVRHVEWWVA